MKVLAVDDEAKILETIRLYLQKEGYSTLTAGNGTDALAKFRQFKPDIIVLDLMLPDTSGEEICKTIREESTVPIIMLTAKSSEAEKVRGLNIGADDYLTKPFSPRELIARIKAHLRRSKDDFEQSGVLLSFNKGELTIDTLKHEVEKNGQKVDLTPIEFKLLLALASYPGRVYSRLELVSKVQGYDFEGYERTIDTHIKNLRQKVEEDAAKPQMIKTVFGVGYKFEEPKN